MSAVVVDQFTRQAASFARLAIADLVLPKAQAAAYDRMGLSLRREAGMITLCYLVAIVAGSKAA